MAEQQLEGESIPIEDVEPDVEDTPDGGAMVRLSEDDEALPGDSDFYGNLAEDMPTHELKSLATKLVESIDRDKQARSKRDELYAEGIKRTGLGDEAPGGAQFEGASKVVHPMLVEACIDFASRAMKELWPASTGPVKTKIEGDETNEKVERADRKAALMNWQLTTQSKEFRAEVEQMLTQVPLGGAQYLKLAWDRKRNRPSGLAVFVDDMLIPFAATNFYSAERKTHVQYLTLQEYEERVSSGMYRDVDVTPTGLEPEQTASAKASDKIEGREGTAYNEDGLRTVYETYIDLKLEHDDEPCPYIVTTDRTTNDVLAIYRNWAEDDESYEALEWIVEFPFVPWRGAYPIGLPHIIGGLSGAATGALRALLDSAHIQNTASGLKLKGAMVSGQNRAPAVGEILEIDGGMQTDDIRKLFMAMPYNPPSPVLFQLLGFLVDAGKGVVRTTLDDIADNDPNVPVGTTLARMEQGMVVYSAIHGRLHDAMGRVLQILHRFNGMYLKNRDVKREVGEDMATRKDFTGPMDIVPVSDPNIYSEAQRYAQAEAITQRAAMFPQLYNGRKVEERFLETLKVPNIDELLVPPTEPEAQNPVAENVAMSLGRPIVAFPEQDHLAHMQAHIAFYINPALGQNPLFQQAFTPAFVGHMKEHMVLHYMAAATYVTEQYTGLNLDKAMAQHEGDEDYKALDRLLAQSAMLVGEEIEGQFKQLMPILQQAQQVAQQMQPPQPMDPATAQTQIAASQVQAAQASARKAQTDAQRAQIEMQVKQIEAQARQAEGQQKGQIEGMKAQAKQAEGQQKMQVEGAKLQQKDQSEQRRLQLDVAKTQQAAQDAEANRQMQSTKIAADMDKADADREAKLAMNEADNQTAIGLAHAELESGERIAVSTGTGINPKP